MKNVKQGHAVEVTSLSTSHTGGKKKVKAWRYTIPFNTADTQGYLADQLRLDVGFKCFYEIGRGNGSYFSANYPGKFKL